MAPHSSTLDWRIPWTEDPGRLQSVHGVAEGQTRLSDFTFTFHFHALEKEKGKATHTSILACCCCCCCCWLLLLSCFSRVRLCVTP